MIHRNATVHLIGIAGSGMLPLAELLLKQGFKVTGSDRLIQYRDGIETLSPPIRKRLNRLVELGAQLFPQDGSGIHENTHHVIYSTAIEEDNPDLKRAFEFKIPTLHRSEALKIRLENYKLLAITGTSGKSTTTGLAAWLLNSLGELGCFISGTELLDSGLEEIGETSVHVSNGAWACAELDESDKSLLRFEPDIAVVLNVSRDHHTYEENLEIFEAFSRKVRSCLLLNRHDRGCQELASKLDNNVRWQWFDPPTNDQIELSEEGSWVKVEDQTFFVPLLGYYNAFNFVTALKAVNVCVPNAPLDILAEAATRFPGLRRRLQTYGKSVINVFDDYAHNPEKIDALLSTMQSLFPRVHLLFQPHGYGPLRFHFNGLIDVFLNRMRKADHLYLLPVYDAGGTANRSISSDDLAAKLTSINAKVFSSRDDAAASLKNNVKAGDAVIIAGARDDSLSDWAHHLTREFSKIT